MKYLAIYGKREKYPIQIMCRFFGVSRSGYYDYIRRMDKPDRDELLHSDQGFQYTSHAYFSLTKEYGIIPSMSRRGNCYDNAMAENFFSILKSECLNRYKLSSFAQARSLIDDFIWFYNHERFQLKTKLTPLEKRRQFD